MQKALKEQSNLSIDGSLGYLPVSVIVHGWKKKQRLERKKQGWELDFEAIMDSENCSIVGEKVIMMKGKPGVTRQGSIWT